MRFDTATGMNRTGIGLSPIDAKELIEAASRTSPPPGGPEAADVVRASYAADAEVLGSMPPPTTLRGAGAAAVEMLKGERLPAFTDKLGERLAFERTGTRIYEAILAKSMDAQDEPRVADIDELRRFHDQERQHFDLLREAVIKLGGDPTAVTPSADVAAVASTGIVQVVSDPRTTVAQCLSALLITELADHDGWTLLARLADDLGYDELAASFRQALAEEAHHLARVRAWVTGATLAEAEPGRTASESG